MNQLAPAPTLDPDRYLAERLNLEKRRESRKAFWRWIEAISIEDPRVDSVFIGPTLDKLVWIAALPDARAHDLERALVSNAPYLLNSERSDPAISAERLTLLLDLACRNFLLPLARAVGHPELLGDYRPGQPLERSVALIESCHKEMPNSVVNCFDGTYQGGYIPGMFQTFSYSGWSELITTGITALDPQGRTLDPELITETASMLLQIESRQFWTDEEFSPLELIFSELLNGFSETVIALARLGADQQDADAASGN
jgi:hypothetical protein